MVKEEMERANILIEALPYIKKYYNKTIVVKYGGNAMINEDLKQAVTIDIVLMKFVGMNPVLVHGGGPEITQVMEKMGKEAEFVSGLRVTDKESVEIVEMVLVGKINKDIVSLINRMGAKAVGLSGKDGNLIIAKKHSELIDLGYVGEVKQINPELLNILIKEGYIPVISPVGIGEDNQSYNINADTVAGAVASYLDAVKLILLTDIRGILKDPKDEESLMHMLSVNGAKKTIEDGIVEKGMVPKVQACCSAIENGVQRAHIIDGRIPHALLMEIFTDKGIGTMITGEKDES